jgi:hypothetical protein
MQPAFKFLIDRTYFNIEYKLLRNPDIITMGKRKIDKSKKIENKNQRSVAFCKRKRGFLKKAIELSRLCD